MDDPKQLIPRIIHSLAEGSPAEQRYTLKTYFTPTPSFTHPLFSVPSFSHIPLPIIGAVNSRWVIWMIYRWYKILLPKTILGVQCSDYNEETQTLFVQINQQFAPCFIPLYKSKSTLTTKFHFVQLDTTHFYIQSQEDLYQPIEFVKFFWLGGATIMWFWQILVSCYLCIFGVLLLAPVTWFERPAVN
ncbi:hypothetical protein BJ875DRAFT_506743 [Amylocarpus encephaloides]|uniref:SigF-like NTF2-like domain-containing protein n=1 Tax=Amylocarpus encephaloides TaxID=45428 RepID=A0A9P8C2E9_9HELO|nr:hypothetical protein BJ875DRAFT_506743 [Amylocarpus encephaloides]